METVCNDYFRKFVMTNVGLIKFLMHAVGFLVDAYRNSLLWVGTVCLWIFGDLRWVSVRLIRVRIRYFVDGVPLAVACEGMQETFQFF